ncbi:MAG: electron transport complex subunit RsxC [Candidatus Krumholzibacteriota bacterium]|nr:electron transport complex subunit RsxC [Candidatus Krumholzibacteriota bacterium]
MSSRGFFGGVHPAYNKTMAESRAIVEMPLPGELVVYFSQNLGAPSKPIVNKGDEVKKGQEIGASSGFVSTPVHAPTSGKIISIEKRPSPVGADILAAVIQPDGKDEWAPECDKERASSDLDREKIRNLIHDGGIVGMGGATFPTHVKLSPPEGKKIDTLIINGAECEPYLTADHRVMLERAKDVLDGASLFALVIGVGKIVIAIEKNKPDAISVMRNEISGRKGFSVEAMDVIYPQGAEKQLIYALTRRKVPAGGLPMDVGVLVQNVGTAAAAYEAVRFNRPLIQRVVTVTGSGIKEPANVMARIGTKFGDLIEFCGGIEKDTIKVINGGPMMGIAQHSLEAGMTKGTSGLVLLTENEVGQYVSDPCIRCGRCLEVCPMRLNPSDLSIYSERIRFDEAGEYNVMDCIECGCCAYVCPSRRPMVHHFRRAKAEIRNKARKAI